MSRRTQRVSNLIRSTVAELVLSKLADPRIDPARTSITRVEMPEDLSTARIYVSVMGTEADQRRTVTALQHACGHLQEMMMRQIKLRTTPALSFVLDTKFKKTLETYQILQKVRQELDEKDQQPSPEGDAQEPPDSNSPGNAR